MKKYIDTHAHYNVRQFKEDREELLERLQEKVKYIINVGTNTKMNLETLQLLSLWDFIYGIIGFFPTDTWMLEKDLCKEADDNWLILTKQLLNQKVVGIGECGLDYHWNCIGPRNNQIYGKEARNIQEKWFRKQIELGIEMNLPICIHSRDAEADTIRILKDYPEATGVVHCFSYGLKAAEFFLNHNFYLGVGGTSTYPRNDELREVIKRVPLNRILLETDAPYLSPQNHRRERNNSEFIVDVIKNISQLKNMSEDMIIDITNNNVQNIFSNKK